jgi:hypothetical protein
MLQVEHLRHYSDALLRLSRETKEPQISAKLHEMADEFRIMVCVADVTGLAADLARDCARDGRQEADKDRISGLPKRQRKRSGRARRTAAKAAPSPHVQAVHRPHAAERWDMPEDDPSLPVRPLTTPLL